MHRPSIYLIALIFGAAGTAHLVWPAAFARIVPPYLPALRTLVYVSGVAELLGALGLLVPGLRGFAGALSCSSWPSFRPMCTWPSTQPISSAFPRGRSTCGFPSSSC
jgi:hypothetical protein